MNSQRPRVITGNVDLSERYEECAAILEYDHGMTRTASEALAREIVWGDKQLTLSALGGHDGRRT